MKRLSQDISDSLNQRFGQREHKRLEGLDDQSLIGERSRLNRFAQIREVVVPLAFCGTLLAIVDSFAVKGDPELARLWTFEIIAVSAGVNFLRSVDEQRSRILGTMIKKREKVPTFTDIA